jgi:hypothetical protein
LGCISQFVLATFNCLTDHSAYVGKDLYGNRDLIAGTTAIHKAVEAHDALQQLTPYYRSFYAVRAKANLEAPFLETATAADHGSHSSAKNRSKLHAPTEK